MSANNKAGHGEHTNKSKRPAHTRDLGARVVQDSLGPRPALSWCVSCDLNLILDEVRGLPKGARKAPEHEVSLGCNRHIFEKAKRRACVCECVSV
jgi:hypothetical protein